MAKENIAVYKQYRGIKQYAMLKEINVCSIEARGGENLQLTHMLCIFVAPRFCCFVNNLVIVLLKAPY